MDTTGSRLNLGMGNGSDIHRVCSLPLGREISTQMHGLLREFVHPQSWQELGCICVIQGPGSYTGSRIGVVTARTLAASLNIPLFGFSSLAIAALVSATKPGLLAIDIPAQRNHVYGAIYEIKLESELPLVIQGPKNLKETDWADVIEHSPSLVTRYTFAYSEKTSHALLDKMMQLARYQWKRGQASDWRNILPAYG